MQTVYIASYDRSVSCDVVRTAERGDRTVSECRDRTPLTDGWLSEIDPRTAANAAADAEGACDGMFRPLAVMRTLNCARVLKAATFGQARAARIFFESDTQPKMPPWALIMRSPMAWNSGK